MLARDDTADTHLCPGQRECVPTCQHLGAFPAGRTKSLVLRPITPPLALGLAVAAVLLAAESLVVYLLKQVVPGNLFGVVFVLGVLVVSLGWGFRLGTITALASALVYGYFHYLQTGGSFVPTDPRHWVAVAVFLVIALSATASPASPDCAPSRRTSAAGRWRRVMTSSACLLATRPRCAA